MLKNLPNFRKAAALMIAMLAVSFCANSQNYWYVMGQYTFSPPEPQGTFEMGFEERANVTVDGMEYTEIVSWWPGVYGPVEEGVYRTEGNQVYFRPWLSYRDVYGEEVLLYDYDLEEGDFFHDNDEHPMQVTSVTTIIDNNGVERKKWEFSFMQLPGETEYWIEGVGSSRGFLNVGVYEPGDDGEVFHLLCMHNGDNVIYVNPEYNTCDIDEIEENPVADSFGIFPNPANEIIKILNDSNLAVTSIEVIDMLGRSVMCVEDSKEINVAELPQGEYFVRINAGEAVITKKLFINR